MLRMQKSDSFPPFLPEAMYSLKWIGDVEILISEQLIALNEIPWMIDTYFVTTTSKTLPAYCFAHSLLLKQSQKQCSHVLFCLPSGWQWLNDSRCPAYWSREMNFPGERTESRWAQNASPLAELQGHLAQAVFMMRVGCRKEEVCVVRDCLPWSHPYDVFTRVIRAHADRTFALLSTY